MFISIWYLVIVVIILGGAYRFWVSHSCAICHTFHVESDLRHFHRCRVCDKLFCKKRITRYEVVEQKITGQLGTSTKILDKRDNKFWDYPCGLEYITTQYQGISISRLYCTIHDPGHRDLSKRPVGRAIAVVQPARKLPPKSRGTHPSLRTPDTKPTIKPNPRQNKEGWQ